MKQFDWNDEKNEKLERERGVTFEEIVYHITHDGLLDIIIHPDQEKYPGQLQFIVNVEEYVHIVPFVETDDRYFLKTIIPSRKMTRKYLGGTSDET